MLKFLLNSSIDTLPTAVNLKRNLLLTCVSCVGAAKPQTTFWTAVVLPWTQNASHGAMTPYWSTLWTALTLPSSRFSVTSQATRLVVEAPYLQKSVWLPSDQTQWGEHRNPSQTKNHWNNTTFSGIFLKVPLLVLKYPARDTYPQEITLLSISFTSLSNQRLSLAHLRKTYQHWTMFSADMFFLFSVNIYTSYDIWLCRSDPAFTVPPCSLPPSRTRRRRQGEGPGREESATTLL